MISVQIEVLPGLNASVGGNGIDSIILRRELEEGSTVANVIRKLATEYQAFGANFLDTKTMALSGLVAVVLNGRLLEVLKGLDIQIKDGDIIRLFPLVSGG